MIHIHTHRLRAFALIMFVILGLTPEISAQQQKYPVKTVDTFTVSKNFQPAGNLIKNFSPNFFSRKPNEYSHLIEDQQGLLYLYNYNKNLAFIDSVKIQNKPSSTINKYIPSSEEYIIYDYTGAYSYSKKNTIIWQLTTFDTKASESFFESMIKAPNGYVISGAFLRNDSMFNSLLFVDTNGLVKKQHNFFLLENNFVVTFAHSLMYYRGNIYFVSNDSNQTRSVLNGGDLIPSSNIFKLDIDGNILSSNQLQISPRNFVTQDNSLLLFGDERDKQNQGQTVYNLYTVDTNLSTILHFKDPAANWMPYGTNSWVSVTIKNKKSITRQNQVITTINVFDVIDSEKTSLSFSTTNTETFADTFTRSYVPMNYVSIVGQDVFLTTNRVNMVSGKPDGFDLYKYSLTKDTLYTYDSLWKVTATPTKTTIDFSWQTLSQRDSKVIIWPKNTGEPVQEFSDTTNCLDHKVIVNLEPGEYEYFVKSVSDFYKDTLVSSIQTITITEGNTGMTNPQGDVVNVSVYPNPSDGKFILETNVSGIITFYSMEGKMLFEEKILNSTNSIDASHLNTGIYLYQFKQNNQIITGKVIIQ